MISVVWHFWISPILVVSGIMMIVGFVGMYLKSVTSKRYPPRGSQKQS